MLLFKPSMDIRFGADAIKSRAGLTQDADILITPDMDLLACRGGDTSPIHCVLVDEVQFLLPRHIEQLREITFKWDVPVICYGLRTDFRTRLFEGSKRLLELADNIEEVKTTCHFCNKKAILNLKHCDGLAVVEGESVQLGCEEMYFPACVCCFNKQLDKAGVAFPTTPSS